MPSLSRLLAWLVLSVVPQLGFLLVLVSVAPLYSHPACNPSSQSQTEPFSSAFLSPSPTPSHPLPHPPTPFLSALLQPHPPPSDSALPPRPQVGAFRTWNKAELYRASQGHAQSWQCLLQFYACACSLLEHFSGNTLPFISLTLWVLELSPVWHRLLQVKNRGGGLLKKIIMTSPRSPCLP